MVMCVLCPHGEKQPGCRGSEGGVGVFECRADSCGVESRSGHGGGEMCRCWELGLK